MASPQDARYRMQLGEGYLADARQDLTLGRWRSCADNCQLAVENALKAVLAMLGPVGRTHDPARFLHEALEAGHFAPDLHEPVQRLIVLGQSLGPEAHVATRYGDEEARRTPWELFQEPEARDAVNAAEEAVALAKDLVETQLS